MTQRAVADALGGDRPLSPALISSWESGKAIPAEKWLVRYAKVCGGPGKRPGDAASAEALETELLALRANAYYREQRAGQDGPGQVLGSFWRFPDEWPIRIIGTPMFARVLEKLDYASPLHPNYIESLRNADIDASIELFGHVRAANPSSDVRFLTDRALQRDDLTGHLILLGGADTSLTGRSPLGWFIRRLDLPIFTRVAAGGDDEYDTEFVVTMGRPGRPGHARAVGEEVYRPTFLIKPDDPTCPRATVRSEETGKEYPQLEYDVGLLVRQPNPMNLQATVTVCAGIFSRGTFGVVRATTDAKLRDANEQYLRENFPGGRFWLLMGVPVFQSAQGAETITPDLSRESHILRQAEPEP